MVGRVGRVLNHLEKNIKINHIMFNLIQSCYIFFLKSLKSIK